MKMTHLSHLPNMNIIGEAGDSFGTTSLTPVSCHLSPVTCHMSHVTCDMSHVTCHLNCSIQKIKKIIINQTYKVVELVCGGFVINGAYPVQQGYPYKGEVQYPLAQHTFLPSKCDIYDYMIVMVKRRSFCEIVVIVIVIIVVVGVILIVKLHDWFKSEYGQILFSGGVALRRNGYQWGYSVQFQLH